MIQPLFEHRLELAGYETRVLELEGDGVPIVMFHGYADSADTWRQSLAMLGRRGRRAIAVDLPGFGSAAPLNGDPVLPQLDAFAIAAVDYLGGRRHKPLIAVGNSLGGCVSLRLAERCGDMLDGVVAVAPAGLEMSRLLSLVERDPLLRSLLALPTPVPPPMIRAAVARLYRQLAFAVPSAIDPAVVSTFCAHHRDRATVAAYLDTGRRLIRELRTPFQLDRISTRVLLVWGDRDRLVFHRGANRILDAVPGSRLELLRGIGHCPQVEVPERFTELLLEFSAEPQAAAA
jgi:pimeloyl-ACP methyl ester carboxylesterase